MGKTLWRGGKFLIPLAVFLYLAALVLEGLRQFWFSTLLHHFSVFSEGWFASTLVSFASIGLTLLLLLTAGYILKMRFAQRALTAGTRRIPVLRYFWSGEDDMTGMIPVLFQYPTPGEWKIGFFTGDIEGDEGKRFWKIFFVTGIGDHVLVEHDHPELVVPLANSVPELLQLVASLTLSGPRALKTRKD